MDNSKFGNRPYDDKTRLAVQLKFFCAKKQKFISVYAKKPRILVKAKSSNKYDSNGLLCDGLRGGQSPMQALIQQRESALRQLQFMQRAQIGIGATQANQQALNMQQGQFNANHQGVFFYE